MSKNATIRDVAREAGVSVATVSRALNAKYPVSDKLRKRIEESVAKLNFHPNAIARTLKTNSTHTIGFLVSDIGNPFFTTILKGVEDVLQPLKYNVISCSTNGVPEIERSYLDMLVERMVDGIIINTTSMNDARIVEISKQTPVVLSHRKVASSDFVGDFVGCDDTNGIRELTAHLFALGHRRIALINGPLHLSSGRERFEGFCLALREYGIDMQPDNPLACNLGFLNKNGYESAELLLKMENRPSAIVSTNSELTLGAMRRLYECGVHIPEDISLVSFGDIPNRDLLYVHPTVSYFNLTTLGNKIGELLMERITADNAINNREVRYMTTMIAGNSTRQLD